MKRLLLILFLILIICTSYGQEVNADTTTSEQNEETHAGLMKNTLFFTAGWFGGFIYNGNYERMIWGNKNPAIRSVMIRVGIGQLFVPESVYSLFSTVKLKTTTYTATLGMLIGKRNSYLEFTAGVVYFNGEETQTSMLSGKEITSDYKEINPAVTLGYRYQKPGDHFVFRVGAGWPDLVHISLGLCF